MTCDDDKKAQDGSYASPPCLAHEIDPTYFDPMAVDLAQARDVARWRKAKRDDLRAARKALSVDEHALVSARMAEQLESVLLSRFDGAHGLILSAYWPIKGEPDLRELMAKLHDAGVIIALPLVETKAAPLIFHLWTPKTKMVRGDWNIPVPHADAPKVTPDIKAIGWAMAVATLTERWQFLVRVRLPSGLDMRRPNCRRFSHNLTILQWI